VAEADLADGGEGDVEAGVGDGSIREETDPQVTAVGGHW
jgi:hypothetical protein